MSRIMIVGIGMGNPKTITVQALEIIKASQAVIGAERMVDSFGGDCELQHYAIKPDQILEWIEANPELEQIAVLMSGDIGFYSGAKKLTRMLPEQYDVHLVPGISSLQYFCAKLKTPWEGVKVISLHGREINYTGVIQTHKRIFVLTDRIHTPAVICKKLEEAGLSHMNIYVGERLSYDDERICSGKPSEIADMTFDPLCVLYIENDESVSKSHSLQDSDFVRGDVPMTKEEVRSVSLAKLQLVESDVVYDIGAGTGSVSVEISFRSRKGEVYAIETKPEALELIRENKRRFGLSHLRVVDGLAPKALTDLPAPDKAFIGGTKGNIEEILVTLKEKNPEVRVVINVIALESIAVALTSLNKCGFDLLDTIQVSVAKAKAAGNYHMMMGQNPVFILTARGRAAE